MAIPCWEYVRCHDEVREKCQAYRSGGEIKCWEVPICVCEEKKEGLCLRCPVFLSFRDEVVTAACRVMEVEGNEGRRAKG